MTLRFRVVVLVLVVLVAFVATDGEADLLSPGGTDSTLGAVVSNGAVLANTSACTLLPGYCQWPHN